MAPRKYTTEEFLEKALEEAEDRRVQQVMDSLLVGFEETHDTSDTFLTPGELKTLTGRERPNAQSNWLSRRGYKFDRSQEGRIILMREELRRHLKGEAPKPRRKGEDEPDWDKMK